MAESKNLYKELDESVKSKIFLNYSLFWYKKYHNFCMVKEEDSDSCKNEETEINRSGYGKQTN
jgi:hypothetical protein